MALKTTIPVKTQPDNLPTTIGIAPVPKQPSIQVAQPKAQPSIGIAKTQPQPKITVQQPSQSTVTTPKGKKLSMVEFAQSIKQKYPQYADKDDIQLAQAMLSKYPQYAEKVAVPQETKPSQSKSVSGFLSNIVGDAGNVLSGLANIVRHPVDTVTGIAKAGYGELRKLDTIPTVGLTATPGLRLIDLLMPDSIKQQADQAASRLNETYAEKIKHPIETVYNEPVSTALDVATLFEGGGSAITGLASKGSKLAKAGEVVTKVGETINPINTGIKVAEKAVNTASKGAKATAEFATSQATGLAPKTISTIKENPEAFSSTGIAKTDRAGLGQKVATGIEERINNLSETGKGYDAVRKSSEVVTVPKGEVEKILSKYNIGLKDGKIVTTKESIPLSAGDKAALQSFVDIFGNESQLSGNAFLNARTELSNMAKYDAAKTGASTTLSRELRSYFDSLGKEQLTGLAKLDSKYAPEVKLLNQIKKDYLAPDGSFKDGALSKLANLTGKGKDQVLARLEKVVPGVTKDINILKAVEDIEIVKGQKVGAYLRGATGGFVVSGGNPAVALITGILTQPAVAVQLIRSYGKTAQIGGKVIEPIVSKMQSGLKLSGQEKAIVQKALQAGTMYNVNQ